MHTATMILALAATLLLAPFAQRANAQSPDAAEQATHDEIRALKAGAEEAFNALGSAGRNGDIEPLLAYVHDKIVLVPMNGETVVGKQGIRKYFTDKMAGPSPTVAYVHHTFNVAALTTLYGDDTGVAYGDSLGSYQLTNGMSFEVQTFWTATMVKEAGKWLLASFQFAPSIFDNPIAAQALSKLYWSAAAAGVIGLIVGLVLARFLPRRSGGG